MVGSSTLTGAFQEAHRWSLNVLSRAALNTYQGLMGALGTWTEPILPRLWQRMHVLMEEYGGDHWRIGSWVPLAVDGSRIGAPRTRANERAFCARTTAAVARPTTADEKGVGKDDPSGNGGARGGRRR